MRYFFIEHGKSTGSTLTITGSDARHIKTVLRLKSGDKVGLFDGKGFEYEAEIVDLSIGRVSVAVIRRFPSTAESPVQITVAQGFLKEKKMDGLVRQLSELGIIKWIPFFAERSIPKPDKKQLSARTRRWEKISKEAIKQCRRGCIMEIGDTVSFEEILNLSQTADLKIAFWEDEFQPLTAELPESDGKIKKIYALLGPEGGFTQQEIEKAKDRGFVSASLGPRILRAETATIAACVLLQHLFGDMR
jgi:16S rRNA (uracil1498-N3)-methyltransferase